MPQSIKFYCGVLGFEIVQTSEPGERFDWAWLRLGGANLMLNTAHEEHERPPAPDPARIAAHGDTVLYFDCPDVEGMCSQLRGHGLAVKDPAVAPYGMKQLYVDDPDGFGLCFQTASE